MKFAILLNSILRLPLHKASALVKEYQKNTGFKNFYEKQRVLDILSHKVNVQKQIKKEAFRKALMYLVFMTREKNEWSKARLLKKYTKITVNYISSLFILV